jgi:hypothetical protein
MEQMTTAVQRTFSHDKYDAMEANIHYVDINEKGNTSPTSKKRKNDKKNYYLVVTVLLTVIAICLLQGAIKNNIDVVDNSPSRTLYENFNLSEMEQYEHNSMLGDDLTNSNHYFNKINLYYNESEFINYEETHEVDKYKKSYYKLLKVCIPQLRRASAAAHV